MKLLPKITLALFGLTSLFLVSCSSSSTETRIKKNPTLFEALPDQQKELVNEGRIANGMEKSAVYLALGKPDRKTVGSKDGNSIERWDYNALRPVYRNSFHGYFGSGFGRYSRFGRSGIGFSPSINYVPVPSSYVNFTDERVTGWQSTTR